MNAVKKTVKNREGRDLGPSVKTIRIVVDKSGIKAPRFANCSKRDEGKYRLRYGFPPGAYVGHRVITATCDGRHTIPLGLCGGTMGQLETDRQVAFAKSLEEYFAGHGFTAPDSESCWVNPDHGDSYRFSELSVESRGIFFAEAQCGLQCVRYEIVDHAAAQRILDAAADDRGMV
jgi:hypothetical protein